MFEVLAAQINIVDCGVRSSEFGVLSSVLGGHGALLVERGTLSGAKHTEREDKRTSSGGQSKTMGKFVVKKQAPERKSTKGFMQL